MTVLKHLVTPTAFVWLGFLTLFTWFGANSRAAEPANHEQMVFFEKQVRPLLAQHCFKCHGEKKQSGSLRLDHLANMLEGGDSGPALVPGHPEESLLIEAIKYESYEMPPTGKLSDADIATLTRWVKMGAPWPGGDKAPAKTATSSETFTQEDRQYWAFQPLTQPEVPEVSDPRWQQNPIDRFIFTKLQEVGIEPAPVADRVTLIRRAYYDLIGLPPSPQEVDEFLGDSSPDAFRKLVDRLLDSPQYGERWARHWLDLVRYAESDGFNQDAYRPEIWRYRDYVIKAFNEDKPYTQFVLEQLAGDEVAPENPDALAATGYLRHYLYEYNQRDARTHWSDILNDVTDATGDVFLGLGMGCARCHDHKFDPILQKDYYRLQAFFTPMLPREDIPFATPAEIEEHRKQLAIWESKTADIRKRIDEILAPSLEDAAEAQRMMFPPDIQEMMRKDPVERTPLEHQIAELANRQVEEKKALHLEKVKTSKDKKWAELHDLYKELEKFDNLRPQPLPYGMTVTDTRQGAAETFIPGREKLGPVEPGFLSVMDASPASYSTPEKAPQSTGRRTALARWITSPDNPLTTRVITNRIWQYHFGTGLVATSSDFGRLGEKPSHPELLDWLVHNFVQNGWSFKQLHRLIMNSETYKLSSAHPAPEVGQRLDPTNRLRWRGEVRRLDAEQIRDASLALSGELKLELGGPSVPASQPRRSIYTIQKRNSHDPVLGAFDLPGGISSTASRNVTTTPTQALLMINGEWMLQRASAMATRVLEENSADDGQLVSAAFALAYSTQPTADQRAYMVEFLRQQRQRIPEAQVPKDGPLTGQLSQSGQAAQIKPGTRQEYLKVQELKNFAAADFTIEAVVQLHSMFENAAVRTIASQWNGNTNHRGWALGITSKQSAYKPRNLILQLVGDSESGELIYEVVPSNLHLELDHAYYVAVAVDIDDPSENGVTFYVKDLEKGTMKVAHAPHRVMKNYRSNAALVLGGRDGNFSHGWDGLIDDVRLSNGCLKQQQLAIQDPTIGSQTVGFWRFEPEPGFYASSNGGPAIIANPDTRKSTPDRTALALTDLCHVLLNSNRFLYLD